MRPSSGPEACVSISLIILETAVKDHSAPGLHLCARDDLLDCLVFDDTVGRQDTAPVRVGIDHRARSNNAAGVEDGIAADLAGVAQQCAELAKARIHGLSIHL